MVAIRFRREGNKNRPFFRLVAITHTKRRDGAYLESLGTYDPKIGKEGSTVNLEAVDAWIAKGAKPSETAASIIKHHRRLAKAAASA